jgi:hypothetical protein
MRHWTFLTFALALAAAGCSGGSGPNKDDKKEDKKEAKEEHKTPHGGDLFATPDHKIHLELVLDDKTATLYALDRNAKKAQPIKAELLTLELKGDKPVKVEFTPSKDKDDPADSCSRFTAPRDKLPKDVDHEKVEISGMIGGKPYRFEPDEH